MISRGKLLWPLVPLDEEASLLLSVVAEELRVELGAVDGSGLVSPGLHVCVVVRCLDVGV